MLQNKRGNEMKKWLQSMLIAGIGIGMVGMAQAADVVPPEIQMPGTQPEEVSLEDPGRCDNCHAGYNDLDPGAEPATGWAGAAMGNAGRDAIFWATLAIAEQDFDGSGDLCIRCHSAGGWYAGRSTPTDGSGLAASDDNGIDCDTCHKSTNTNNSEHLGVMNSPFIANCSPDSNVPNKCTTTGSTDPVDTIFEGFYGSGILSLWGGSEKLGPYDDAEARHQWMSSSWHRSPDFCGTCHDVSNSAVGDLAPGNGAQHGAPFVISSQGTDPNNLGLPNLGGPIEEKAAFNNPPYAYGIVERTFSEYKSSPLHSMPVSNFNSLPADLKDAGGSLEVTYQAAMAAAADATANGGNPGDYADGTERTFSCQSCHMRPTTGAGCDKNGAPTRTDLPRHDHTGGNYWFASMTQYQDAAGTLRMGGGLSSFQLLAMDLGQERATKHLSEAGSLEVINNSVKVTNLTGHKLITGYPEGRRMWLRIEWKDGNGDTIYTDGDYGSITVDLDGDGQVDDTVESIIDLSGTNTKIYEAKYAMTKEWADTLLAVGYDAGMVLDYDRYTGAPVTTLGDLAAMAPGSYVDTFHFALNNYVAKDNRIPPYLMSYDEAKKRNALPNPETQFGNPGAGGVYDHWDTVDLNPPANAVSATIELLYQGTSWEYIQFLQKANNGQNAFLGNQGDAMMDAWLNADVVKSTGDPIDPNLDGDSDPTTGVGIVMNVNGDYKMVPPVVMETATWGVPVNSAPTCSIDSPAGDITINEGDSINYAGTATDSDGTIASYSWTFEGGSPASSSVEDPGSVSYSTAGNYTTTFTATDNEGASCATASVNVTVNVVGGNNAPVANDDSYTIEQDTTLTVNAPGVRGNDNDPDGDAITSVQDSSPGNGSATLNADGSFSYTPNAGFFGTDSFTYHAVDSNGANSNTATVTIDVTQVGNMACADYADKGSCNNDPACEWSGNPKNGSCGDAVVCEPTEPTETTCNDGVDSDCDGAVDCADSDCSGDPACPQADCSSITDKNACNAEATCNWNNRTKTCDPI
jgi:hypothetical protein